MNTTITGCSDCPLSNYNDEMIDWTCQHPKGEQVNIKMTKKEYSPITPLDCPLKEEGITISY